MCRPGGPYWEKLCQRSWVQPEAAGQGPYSSPRAQFFPIWTDLGRQLTCLLFSSIEYFVSSFCVEFSLPPFSNLVYACVWHLEIIFGMTAVVIWIHNCLFLRSLFTFYVLYSEKKNCWKRRKSWKISSGLYTGSGWENLDRWSARNQPIRFKDLGFWNPQMHEKIIINKKNRTYGVCLGI